MEEITVTVWPPAGAGMQTVVDRLTGNTVQQFLPGIEYKNVKYLSHEPGWVSFTTRTGDKIVSTLPYTIQQVTVPDPNTGQA
jgi:hypothetical protein